MPRRGVIVRRITAAIICLALTQCAGAGLPGSVSEPDAGSNTMAGRWMLSAPNAPTCGMAFRDSGGRGSVSPEGGCPGGMFRSRQWALEQGALVIKADGEEALARLTLNGDSFTGQSVSGVPLTLVRYAPPAAQ